MEIVICQETWYAGLPWLVLVSLTCPMVSTYLFSSFFSHSLSSGRLAHCCGNSWVFYAEPVLHLCPSRLNCYNADLQGLYGTNAGCSSALTAALHSNTLPKVEKVPNGQCLVTTSEGETMHGCPVLSEAITSCIKACTF